MRPGDMVTRLAMTAEQAARLVALLDRAGPAAIELERLADRGLWFMVEFDADYPTRLRTTLNGAAPPILFGAGARELLGRPSVAIVGSRDASDEALEFARALGAGAAEGGASITSGGARGVDYEAMSGALEAGGMSTIVVPEQLERRVRDPASRRAIAEGRLVVVSPYAPGAGFSVRGAMGRNKIVYCLSQAAIVVTAKQGTGGTWAGAEEALHARWVPVFVRGAGDPGSSPLVSLGARVLPWLMPPNSVSIGALLEQEVSIGDPAPAIVQETLFGGESAAKPTRRRRPKKHSGGA